MPFPDDRAVGLSCHTPIVDVTIAINEATKDALQALVPVVGGLLIAYLGFRFTRGLERERWARDHANHVRDEEARSRERTRTELRELLARHVSNCERIIAAGIGTNRHDAIPAHIATNTSLAEIRMLAPDLGDKAGELVQRANENYNMLTDTDRELDESVRDAFVFSLREFEEMASARLR